MITKPKDLESYVQYIYSTLLNLRDEGVVVSSNTVLVGRSGAKHEIDVFYQFEKSGVVHKVAFECKFKTRRVEKSEVVDFHGKIQDIGNIQGIFVSKNGYQSGAVDYANHYGIKLLSIEDLPAINILLAKRIESVALPDETYVGEPFWVLMEVVEQRLTGSYWSKKEGGLFKKNIIPLFISKLDANNFLADIPDRTDFVVRGLPQHSLRFLLRTTEIARGKVNFSLMLSGKGPDGAWPGELTTPAQVGFRFLVSNTK